MKIVFEKINPAFHMLIIHREDGSSESAQLHSETYFLHDLCHFVVEAALGLKEGFWGMLSDGYAFEQLAGKTNELTGELREIEKIVERRNRATGAIRQMKICMQYRSRTALKFLQITWIKSFRKLTASLNAGSICR